jgi:hypothetical protein
VRTLSNPLLSFLVFLGSPAMGSSPPFFFSSSPLSASFHFAHSSLEEIIWLEVCLALPPLEVLSTCCTIVDGFSIVGSVSSSSSRSKPWFLRYFEVLKSWINTRQSMHLTCRCGVNLMLLVLLSTSFLRLRQSPVVVRPPTMVYFRFYFILFFCS